MIDGLTILVAGIGLSTLMALPAALTKGVEVGWCGWLSWEWYFVRFSWERRGRPPFWWTLSAGPIVVRKRT